MTSTPTIGLTGNSYATIATADTYLGDAARALAWSGLSTSEKARALISATRLLDKQCWQGVKTNASPTQTMQWPRTGVMRADGTTVDPATVPLEIIDGMIELAFDLSQDTSLEGSSSTASNIRRAKAGSAEVEFFRPGGAFGTAGSTRFPTEVMEYVGQFMCGFRANTGAIATGTGACSQFDNSDFDEVNHGL